MTAEARKSEILEKMREKVRGSTPGLQDDPISLCYYLKGVNHRLYLRDRDIPWNLFECVYFWIGPDEPESPDKMARALRQGLAEQKKALEEALAAQKKEQEHALAAQKKLEESVEALRDLVQRLQLDASSTQLRQAVFDACQTWKVLQLVVGSTSQTSLFWLVADTVTWELVDRVLELKPSIASEAGCCKFSRG